MRGFRKLHATLGLLALAAASAKPEKLSPKLRGALQDLVPPTPKEVKVDGPCFDGPLKWESKNNQIYVGGEVFHLKGTNWYGCETADNRVQGLDARSADSFFKFLQENKFNAVRIPFSLRFALNPWEKVWGWFADQSFNGLTRFELLDRIISKAADYNILIMLDFHRLNDQFIPELWYSFEDSTENMLKGWDTVLDHFKSHWNVFAIDLKNEPHGAATWGRENPSTDWNDAAVQIAEYLLKRHSDWPGLVFVEGINYSTDFRGYKDFPIDLGKEEWNDRLVLSPHQYGPSVVELAMFHAPNFPANMPDEWESHWGFLTETQDKAVILGEWGGHYTGLDRVWQDAFGDYLVDKCLSSQFQWDLNPTSGDTGGLVQDNWWTPEWDKLKVLDKVQPNPSYLSFKDNKVCLTRGQWANPKCNNSQERKQDEKVEEEEVPVVVAAAVEEEAAAVEEETAAVEEETQP